MKVTPPGQTPALFSCSEAFVKLRIKPCFIVIAVGPYRYYKSRYNILILINNSNGELKNSKQIRYYAVLTFSYLVENLKQSMCVSGHFVFSRSRKKMDRPIP